MTVLSLGLAVDGAISGLVAVLLMTLFEVPFWYRFGIRGVVQWQANEIMVSRLFSKSYVEGKRLGSAIGMHLFHGISLGILFSILTNLAVPVLLSSAYLAGPTGLAYSVALWVFVPFSFRNVLQRAGSISFTRGGMTVSLLAHLVYGFALGELLFILLG